MLNYNNVYHQIVNHKGKITINKNNKNNLKIKSIISIWMLKINMTNHKPIMYLKKCKIKKIHQDSNLKL